MRKIVVPPGRCSSGPADARIRPGCEGSERSSTLVHTCTVLTGGVSQTMESVKLPGCTASHPSPAPARSDRMASRAMWANARVAWAIGFPSPAAQVQQILTSHLNARLDPHGSPGKEGIDADPVDASARPGYPSAKKAYFIDASSVAWRPRSKRPAPSRPIIRKPFPRANCGAHPEHRFQRHLVVRGFTDATRPRPPRRPARWPGRFPRVAGTRPRGPRPRAAWP